jgi:hypothetical protein
MRALPSRAPDDRMVQRLIESMGAGTRLDSAGDRVAPNVYTIRAHPNEMDHWRDLHRMETLVEALKESGDQAGIRFATPPSIELTEDPAAAPGEFHVAASHRDPELKETQDVVAATPAVATGIDAAAVPENAFLIVEGVKEFALREAVINIGRRLDNHLVIEDPRVSRHHAQLRAINGRFVLFDLDSSGGSFVNGQRLSQGILYPGDVISLAGVSLIYGQDTPLPQPPADATAPRRRPGTDRPTTILRFTRENESNMQ